jgi:hypothetical protein
MELIAFSDGEHGVEELEPEIGSLLRKLTYRFVDIPTVRKQ